MRIMNRVLLICVVLFVMFLPSCKNLMETTNPIYTKDINFKVIDSSENSYIEVIKGIAESDITCSANNEDGNILIDVLEKKILDEIKVSYSIFPVNGVDIGSTVVTVALPASDSDATKTTATIKLYSKYSYTFQGSKTTFTISLSLVGESGALTR